VSITLDIPSHPLYLTAALAAPISSVQLYRLHRMARTFAADLKTLWATCIKKTRKGRKQTRALLNGLDPNCFLLWGWQSPAIFYSQHRRCDLYPPPQRLKTATRFW